MKITYAPSEWSLLSSQTPSSTSVAAGIVGISTGVNRAHSLEARTNHTTPAASVMTMAVQKKVTNGISCVADTLPSRQHNQADSRQTASRAEHCSSTRSEVPAPASK
eukprot:924339-Rhodomonas_salina.1